MAYLDALLGLDTRTEKEKEQAEKRSKEYRNKIDKLGITNTRERLARVRAYSFLTRVREGGNINMFHGPELLRKKYKLPRREAMKIFTEWTSFNHSQKIEEVSHV